MFEYTMTVFQEVCNIRWSEKSLIIIRRTVRSFFVQNKILAHYQSLGTSADNRPWADGVLMHPHYLHSLVFSFTPGSVDLQKAC